MISKLNWVVANKLSNLKGPIISLGYLNFSYDFWPSLPEALHFSYLHLSQELETGQCPGVLPMMAYTGRLRLK